MQALDSAIGELKNAASKGTRDKRIQGTIDRVAEYLLLLKSPSPPAQSIRKLSLALRKPLLPLYTAFPQQTLHLSATVLVAIFDEKVSSQAADSKAFDQISLWETVQTELISGILDFLEANETIKIKEIISEALYQGLCDLYLPSVTTPRYKSSTLLKTAVYTLLHESAASSNDNQQKLRDAQMLGSKRLGLTLAHTTEYLALEALLTLFARLLPPATNKSGSGRPKRLAFIREVVHAMSGEGIARAEEIISALDFAISTPWEETSVKIFEILSTNISFPQPFHVDCFRVGNITFPQPLPEDRLYIDQKNFFANVGQGNVYETFQAMHSQVTGINLASDTNSRQSGNMMIIIQLSSPPLVGNSPMVFSDGETPLMIVELRTKDVERFLQALRNRGLGRRIIQNTKKISKADSSTILDFGETSQIGSVAPSVEDKYRTVEQFIEDMCSEGHISSDPPVAKPPVTNVAGSPRDLALAPTGDSLVQTEKTGHALLRRSTTQVRRDAVFGTSDEELSEVSDSDDNAVKRVICSPPGKSSRDPSLTNKHTLLREESPLFSQTQPMKSGVRGLARRKQIIIDSDVDSGDDIKEMKPESGVITALPADPPLVSSCDNDPNLLKTSDSAVKTKALTKATSVSDASEPETVSSMGEHVLINRVGSAPSRTRIQVTADKRLDDLTGKTEATDVNRPQAPPKYAHATKRKREVAKESGPLMDSIAPDLELSPRSASKRLRQHRTEDHEGSSAVSKPGNLEQVLKQYDADKQQPYKPQPGVSTDNRGNVADKPRRFANRKRTSSMKSKGTSDLLTSRSVKNENDAIPVTKNSKRTRHAGNNANPRQSSSISVLPMELDKQDPIVDIDGRKSQTDGPIQFNGPGRGYVVADGIQPKLTSGIPGDLENSTAQDIPRSADDDLAEKSYKFPIDNSLKSTKPNVKDPSIFTSTPSKDVVAIDLTIDESPAATESRPIPSLITALKDRLPKHTMPPQQSPETPRVQHSVTFASDRESISPISSKSDFYKGRFLDEISRSDHKRGPAMSSHKGRKKFHEKGDRVKPNKDPGIQDIVDVLNKIHQAITQRITGKLQGIKDNVQYGRTMILDEAADNLADMCAQSAEHFNTLVDLENEYGTSCRKVIDGIEDLSRTNGHMRQQIQQTIHTNDRHTLSKKFSNSLFTASLDDMFHDLALA